MSRQRKSNSRPLNQAQENDQRLRQTYFTPQNRSVAKRRATSGPTTKQQTLTQIDFVTRPDLFADRDDLEYELPQVQSAPPAKRRRISSLRDSTPSSRSSPPKRRSLRLQQLPPEEVDSRALVSETRSEKVHNDVTIPPEVLMPPPPQTPRKVFERIVPSSQSPVTTPLSIQSRGPSEAPVESPLRELSTNTKRLRRTSRANVHIKEERRALRVEDTYNEKENSQISTQASLSRTSSRSQRLTPTQPNVDRSVPRNQLNPESTVAARWQHNTRKIAVKSEISNSEDEAVNQDKDDGDFAMLRTGQNDSPSTIARGLLEIRVPRRNLSQGWIGKQRDLLPNYEVASRENRTTTASESANKGWSNIDATTTTRTSIGRGDSADEADNEDEATSRKYRKQKKAQKKPSEDTPQSLRRHSRYLAKELPQCNQDSHRISDGGTEYILNTAAPNEPFAEPRLIKRSLTRSSMSKGPSSRVKEEEFSADFRQQNTSTASLYETEPVDVTFQKDSVLSDPSYNIQKTNPEPMLPSDSQQAAAQLESEHTQALNPNPETESQSQIARHPASSPQEPLPQSSLDLDAGVCGIAEDTREKPQIIKLESSPPRLSARTSRTVSGRQNNHPHDYNSQAARSNSIQPPHSGPVPPSQATTASLLTSPSLPRGKAKITPSQALLSSQETTTPTQFSLPRNDPGRQASRMSISYQQPSTTNGSLGVPASSPPVQIPEATSVAVVAEEERHDVNQDEGEGEGEEDDAREEESQREPSQHPGDFTLLGRLFGFKPMTDSELLPDSLMNFPIPQIAASQESLRTEDEGEWADED